ncbi:MAG: 30S ribosomal protein S5, partial [Nitrospinae bacterium]|nr:30S ribosomal protein S5 [Nitrospinota bacterium]
GSSNPFNVVHATMKALQSLRSPDEIRKMRATVVAEAVE